MKPEPESNPFVTLRAAVADCLRHMAGDVELDIRGIDVVLDGETIPIRFPSGPKLTDAERVVVSAIRTAGEPLQQKEIAARTDLGMRTVGKLTPELVRRGVLLKHPTLGFYLPGMTLADFPP